MPRDGEWTARCAAPGQQSGRMQRASGSVVRGGPVTGGLMRGGLVWGGLGDAQTKARLVEILATEPGKTIDVSVPESPVTR